MTKRNGKDAAKAIDLADRFLWLVILAPVLAVSGWSLFYVATHIGVPRPVAACFSACFDGAALLSARYALKYAERGISGTFPRTITRVWALLAAFVQTLHARLGGEPPAAALVWASLPITAVVIYEIHVRWVRREALARAGTIYPAALPGFGVLTWVMFPWKTWFAMRTVVGKRKDAIVTAAEKRPVLMAIEQPKETVRAEVVKEPAVVRPASVTSISAHSPTKHIREWAKENGYPVGDRARLARRVIEDYHEAHRASGE